VGAAEPTPAGATDGTAGLLGAPAGGGGSAFEQASAASPSESFSTERARMPLAHGMSLAAAARNWGSAPWHNSPTAFNPVAKLPEQVASCLVRSIFRKLLASEPFRSAGPLAAIGIACLGLIPTLGGPERPLHWAMTGGLLLFGVLLFARHRFGRQKTPLGRVDEPAARAAGRTVLVVSAVIGALVAVIVGARLRSGGSIAALSLAMPAVALGWLASLGLKAARHREPALEPAATSDRPSRRPPNWEPTSGAQASQAGSSNRQVSA
jgi:hypothetical protein